MKILKFIYRKLRYLYKNIFTYKNNIQDKLIYSKFNLPSLYTILSKFDPDSTYSYMNGMYFSKDIPNYVKNHRNYFKNNNRGFGEDLFHVLWFLIFRDFRPKDVLEIGVYRGQILILWSLLSKEMKLNSNIYGLSPLKNINDSVSEYINIYYESDIKKSCEKFNIKVPNLIKEFSNSKVGMEFINSKKWDLIYIDGSHDYEIVKKDFLNSFNSLKENGIIVIDDSSLYLNLSSRTEVFRGHPGPSRICSEMALFKMKHVGTVGHNNIFQKI